jgi:hypothetical protein
MIVTGFSFVCWYNCIESDMMFTVSTVIVAPSSVEGESSMVECLLDMNQCRRLSRFSVQVINRSCSLVVHLPQMESD